MAKKEKAAKNILERTYNIPLRKEWLKVPRYKRAKKAVKAVKEFLMKHMKSEDVKIGKRLNLKLWEHGIKNPPHHIKVNAVKYSDGLVRAELFGFDIEEKEKEKKKEKSKKEKEEDSVKKELGLEEKAKETTEGEEEETSAKDKGQEQQGESEDKSAEKKPNKKSAGKPENSKNIK